MCVPDAAKNLNIKFFNLILRTNETRHKKCHETCECKCRLDAGVCNNKQCWSKDKCMCEYKKMIDKGVCDKGFICNPSNCECECDKSCDIGEYLDYSNCKCSKRSVDKLVEECTESIEETILIETSSKNKHRYRSCPVHVVFFLDIFHFFYN